MTDLSLDNENSNFPIADDTVLWRRVPPEKVVYDENQKRKRPSSDQFKDNINGTPMSVWDSLRCSGLQSVIKGFEHCFVASVTAVLLRESGMIIVRAEKEGVGHCEVIGPKSKSIRTHWAKNSLWEIGPPEE